MNSNTWNTIWIFLVLFFLSLLFVFSWNTPHLPPPSSFQDIPDAQINLLHATQFDHEGNISKTMFSKKVYYYSAKQQLRFIEPHLQLFQRGFVHWTFQSSRGKSEHWFDSIVLNQDVRIFQPLQPEWQFKTSQLWIKPSEQKAWTNQAVQGWDQNSSVEALGINILLDQDSVELLHSTRAFYASNS